MSVLERLDHPYSQMLVQAKLVLKVLGKSKLFLLDILLRESVQNSLDAADKNPGHVTVGFDVLRCHDHADLTDRISFLARSKKDQAFKRLVDRQMTGDPVLLVLSDRGTTGLSGPVRRDSRDWETYPDRRNFENLVYQLGVNHGDDLAGGSYGFGKSIFYHLASSGLVMFYSRVGEKERLAFCMISKEENTIKNSTGIAWWGEVYDKKKSSAPIEKAAEIIKILKQMGLSNKRLERGQTGTVICIVAPKLQNLLITEEKINDEDYEGEQMGTDEAIQAVKQMVTTSVQKWFWPRMTITGQVHEKGELKPLKFINSGEQVRLEPQYEAMGSLLRTAENSIAGQPSDNESIKAVQITTQRYGNVLLGVLAYRIIPHGVDMNHLNRIFMIRWPRMVVFDMPVQGRPEYPVAGLFLVNSKLEVQPNNKSDSKLEKLDNAFKECESATHSEWNYQDLGQERSWFRTYVKTAKERVVSAIGNAVNPVNLVTSDSELLPSAKILGKLLSSTDSGGIEKFKPKGNSSAGGGGGGNTNPKLQVQTPEYLPDGNIRFTLTAENLTDGTYNIPVLAKGARSSYDSGSWKKNLGNEFPFRILECTGDVDVTTQEDTSISFSPSANPAGPVTINLTIQPVKKDALISFNIFKTENLS